MMDSDDDRTATMSRRRNLPEGVGGSNDDLPHTGRPRWVRPVAVLAVIGILATTGAALFAGGSINHDLRGTITVFAPAGATKPCDPQPGTSDIVPGVTMAASGLDGRVLAQTTLGGGSVTKDRSGCAYRFDFSSFVPSSDLTLSVAQRAGLRLTVKDLQLQGNILDLRIGASTVA